MNPVNKDTPVGATRINRCDQVHINNPIGSQPTVTFSEQEVLTLEDGRKITTVGRQLTIPADMERVIPLRNPGTGELIGSDVTGEFLYVILYSLFWAVSDADVAGEAE